MKYWFSTIPNKQSYIVVVRVVKLGKIGLWGRTRERRKGYAGCGCSAAKWFRVYCPFYTFFFNLTKFGWTSSIQIDFSLLKPKSNLIEPDALF